MQHGRKQKHPRIVEEEIRQALLQAETRRYNSFLKSLDEVASILAKNPDCFQEQRTAFAAVKKHTPLGPFENRFLALFLHSLFVGNEFHQLTDPRRKIETELDTAINSVRREELERELDKYIPPIEREKQNLNNSDLERLARLSLGIQKRWNRGRTRRLRVGPWHIPMTQADYEARLGLSNKAVRDVMKKLRPEGKRLPQSRPSEPVRYPPETNWRVLKCFLRTTKRGAKWKQGYCLALLDYYQLHSDKKSIKAVAKVFAGTKFPRDEVSAIADYFLRDSTVHSPAGAPFAEVLFGKTCAD